VILWLLLIASPFPFEIKSGFVFEPVVGSSIADHNDSESLNFGLRLSYLFSDTKDRCLTFETQGQWQLLPQAKSTSPTDRVILEGSFVFYEFYNPFAFRLALGGGVERRDIANTKKTNWSGLGVYRGGFGYYLAKEMGVWIDLNQRQIFRESDTGKIYRSAPLEFSLSSQWIF